MSAPGYFSASGFAPASPQAASIDGLMWLTLAIMGLIFLLVFGLIAASIYKSSRLQGDGEPVQTFGNARLETGWTLGSLLTVAILFGLTVPVLHASHPFEPGQEKPAVTVIGHQWWWEVRYPTNPPVYSANEIHVPIGKKSLLELQSADVIHDFWVPQLGPKQDMVPGTTQYLWLEPQAAGNYDGTCAEFCGNEHAWMRIRVVAQTPEEFDAWIKSQQTSLAALSPHAERGGRLFVQNACNSCHAVSPDGARVAPDLTHVAQRQTLGAGVMENSDVNLALWIKNPQAIKPQCNMPSFQLPPQDLADITTYLLGVK
ncbi:unnamed protein product, partial [Phaeothamnion confervicola]